MGKGLKSFCAKYGFTLFICHFHLIRAYGATAIAGSIVREVLRVATRAELLVRREFIRADIEELREAGVLPEADVLLRFIGWGAGGWSEFEHGIWLRMDGIPTCNNHAEGFHRLCNRKDGRAPFLERLKYIFDLIKSHIAGYSDETHQEAVRRSMKRITSEFAQSDHCDCAMTVYTAALLGIEHGGCCHVGYFEPEFKAMPELAPFDNVEDIEVIEDRELWQKAGADRTPRDIAPVDEGDSPSPALHARLLKLARIVQGIDKEHSSHGVTPSPRFVGRRSELAIAFDLRALLTLFHARAIVTQDEKGYRAFCNKCFVAASGRTVFQGQEKAGLDGLAEYIGAEYGQ
jgi:hypothetical protein